MILKVETQKYGKKTSIEFGRKFNQFHIAMRNGQGESVGAVEISEQEMGRLLRGLMIMLDAKPEKMTISGAW